MFPPECNSSLIKSEHLASAVGAAECTAAPVWHELCFAVSILSMKRPGVSSVPAGGFPCIHLPQRRLGDERQIGGHEESCVTITANKAPRFGKAQLPHHLIPAGQHNVKPSPPEPKVLKCTFRVLFATYTGTEWRRMP